MVAPKRPKNPHVYDAPPPDEDDGTAEFADEATEKLIADERALASAIGELLVGDNDGGVVSVYRQGTGGARDLEYLDDYSPREWSKKQVQMDYGAGMYRAQVKNANGAFITHRSFKVGVARSGEPPRSEVRAQAATQAPGAMDLITILDRQQATMLAGFEKLAQSLAQPKTDLKEILGYIPLIMPLFDTIMGARAAAPAADPVNMLSSVLGAVKEIRDLSNDDGGAPGSAPKTEADIWVTLINKFGGPLGQVFEKMLAANPGLLGTPAAVTDVRQPTAPVLAIDNTRAAPALPAPAGVNIPNNLTAEEMDDYLKLAAMLPGIELAARMNADPATTAQQLLDALRPATLTKMLAEADWFKDLTTFAPGLAPYEGWCVELRELLAEALGAVRPNLTTAAASGTTAEPITGTANAIARTAGADNAN